MSSVPQERSAVVLIGHGSPATDCPPRWVGELMALEWRDQHEPSEEEPRTRARAEELEAAIRNWPRTPQNDPYKTGLERLAQTLHPLVPTTLLAIGYNEFCRPSIHDAIAQVIAQGATRVLVLPTMMTPGGVHSEQDIPRTLDEVRRLHPGISIEYLWPFHLEQVAALLAAHVRQAMNGSGTL